MNTLTVVDEYKFFNKDWSKIYSQSNNILSSIYTNQDISSNNLPTFNIHLNYIIKYIIFTYYIQKVSVFCWSRNKIASILYHTVLIRTFHTLFNFTRYKIIFENSQHKNKNLKEDFVRFKGFWLAKSKKYLLYF